MVREYLMVLVLVGWLSSSVNGLIRHCYSDTDEKREWDLKKYPKVKTFLETNKHLNGRLGDVIFVNWQDPVFTLKINESRLFPGANKKSTCTWRMTSPRQEEADTFNEKAYMTNELHADPMNARSAFRTLSCEREDCVQFFNVFVRPLPKPDFPIQIYYGNEHKVTCSLQHMDNTDFHFYLKYQNLPITFQWTGPKDCPEKYFDDSDPAKCKYYHVPDTCGDDCTINFENVAPDILNLNKTAGKEFRYKDTLLFVKRKKLDKKDKEIYDVAAEYTEYWSQLVIKKANKDHDGLWRCIVIDGLGISSEPDPESRKEIKKKETFHHRGLIDIHCKDLWLTIAIPLGISAGLIIFITICMFLPKSLQCTDFEEEDKQEEQEQEQPQGIEAKKSMDKSLEKIVEMTEDAKEVLQLQVDEEPQVRSVSRSLHSSLQPRVSKDTTKMAKSIAKMTSVPQVGKGTDGKPQRKKSQQQSYTKKER